MRALFLAAVLFFSLPAWTTEVTFRNDTIIPDYIATSIQKLMANCSKKGTLHEVFTDIEAVPSINKIVYIVRLNGEFDFDGTGPIHADVVIRYVNSEFIDMKDISGVCAK